MNNIHSWEFRILNKFSQQSDSPFMLLCSGEDALFEDCPLLSEGSVTPGVSEESVREDVVLVRSVEVTVTLRCHAGMLGAGVEPTIGEGNCFLEKS